MLTVSGSLIIIVIIIFCLYFWGVGPQISDGSPSNTWQNLEPIDWAAEEIRRWKNGVKDSSEV